MRPFESCRPLTLLFAAALTLLPLHATSFASGVTVTNVTKLPSTSLAARGRGPCIQAVGYYFVPGGCEPSCYLYCTDPCSEVDWFDAYCQMSYGPCKRKMTALADYMCRDCSCTWPYGGCADLGLYESGTFDVVTCN
jgi:hypothetical protein